MKMIEKHTKDPVFFKDLMPTVLFRLAHDTRVYMKTAQITVDGLVRNAHRMKMYANNNPGWFVNISECINVYPLDGAYIENPCKECLNE